jgi:hypothetical protein
MLPRAPSDRTYSLPGRSLVNGIAHGCGREKARRKAVADWTVLGVVDATASSGLNQLVRKQMSFHGQIVAALQISGAEGRLGLSHELLDLARHLLLAGVELESRSFLQVLFGRSGKLLGRGSFV